MTMRVLALASAMLLLGLVGPAAAIGAQGVDLTPLLPREDGTLTASVAPESTIALRLTNTTDEERTVTLYVTDAVEAVGGGTGVGQVLDWVYLPATVTLAPQEVREVAATLDMAAFRAHGDGQVLFMMEVGSDGNVVPRAATIVALRDAGGEVSLPTGLVLLALWLLLMVSAGLAAEARRRRRARADVPEGYGAPELAFG